MDIVSLNEEIRQIVARQETLRTQIDAIVAALEESAVLQGSTAPEEGGQA